MGILCPTPSPKAIRQVLSDLLGKDVVLEAEARRTLEPDAAVAVAIFVSETGTLAAISACDVTLGAALGCALALLPPARVRESEALETLEPDVAENLYEVFNVMSTLFNAENKPHIILDGMVVVPDPLPAPVARMLANPVGHLPLSVSVPGYGRGAMTVAVR